MTLYLPSRRQVDDGLDDRAYGPTSHHSELSLLQGYGASAVPPVSVERLVAAQWCVCGGLIEPERVSDIFAAVFEHNATQLHLVWRARHGIA